MRSISSAEAASPSPDRSSVARPAAWPQAAGRVSTAILLLGAGPTEGVEPLKRCFATALPDAEVLPFIGQDRETMVRRLFAEVKADAYVVTDEVRDPLAVARGVATVVRDGADLVIVTAMPEAAFADMGDHLLAATLNYLFGCGAGSAEAVAIVCSHRFARSYAGDGSALDLALQALRRRMPVGEVTTLALADAGRPARPARTLRGWVSLAGLLLRLFAEERPRRTFGLAGLAAIAAGIMAATPAIRIHDWHAGLMPGWISILPLGLTGIGVGAGTAGLLLDAMVQARQDVSRIGYAAIARRPTDESGSRSG